MPGAWHVVSKHRPREEKGRQQRNNAFQPRHSVIERLQAFAASQMTAGDAEPVRWKEEEPPGAMAFPLEVEPFVHAPPSKQIRTIAVESSLFLTMSIP